MTYAIGDIHGQHQKLCELLNVIRPKEEDTVVFIGDYIDRGPDSAGVVQTLIELKESVDCVFLRGNHEQMLLEARAQYDPAFTAAQPDPNLMFFASDGAHTLESYAERFGTTERWYERVPPHHWEFFVSTEMEFAVPGFRFVHAGFLPSGAIWEVEGLEIDPRLWIREPFLSSQEDFGGIVVFGHTPQHSGRPLMMENKIGIDTAAAYGGPLTAIAIDGLHVEVIQV